MRWPVGAQYADMTGIGTLDGVAADLMEASTHSLHLSELYKKDLTPKGVSISSQILTFLKRIRHLPAFSSSKRYCQWVLMPRLRT